MASSSQTVKGILGPEGTLAHSKEGFEFRSSQMEMALLIEESLREGLPAIVEAGTGTGKTFGYLVPLILTGKKAVISTGTKNLQEQIFYKDIPFLREKTGLKVDSMLMKGRRNYLCLYRYDQYFSQGSLLERGAARTKKALETWIGKTRFADFAELSWMAEDDSLRDLLSASSEQCLGAECPFFDECFLGTLRSEAARCSLVIVNHHLFFADLRVKRGGYGEIIPRFQVVLFDEAHKVEEVATSYLGESLSTNQIAELAADLEKETKEFSEIDKGGLKRCFMSLKREAESIREFFLDREDRGRVDSESLEALRLGPGRGIEEGLRFLLEDSGLKEQADINLQALILRVEELKKCLGEILEDRDRGWLHWYVKKKKGLVLNVSPLNISQPMKELLYPKVETAVFTSATLSINNTFDFISSRLGLPEDRKEGIYPSHFDFQHQTLMYIPKDIPLPGTAAFAPAVAKEVLHIVGRTKGRALVLFTSYHNLNLVYQILEDQLPYSISRQGDAPRSVLLDEFKRDVHSVLLATGSFWQGVDVPGEALSCLIVDKLPFDSPSEPLVAARIEAIRENGGNPFMDYQVPSAVISLKQGLGRLIRKSDDKGILSVLDGRILKSRYGKVFLDSLPRIPVTHNVFDIDGFLGGSS